MEKLPALIEPSTVIGTLTKKAAEDCGLVQGTPIVSGAYDKPSDTLGSGSNVVGAIVDNAATYPALTMCVDRYSSDLINKTLECHPAAVPGTWLVMTYITGGGLTHRWFVETFCIDGEKGKETAYEELNRLAEKLPPGSQGLLCVPHFCGRATPCNPKVRGQWIGVTWEHKREHFYRSILESIAYDHATSLHTAVENYPHIDFTHATVLGGGAQSDLWNQIKADVLGITYHRRDREDFTTLGAAIIGGHAVGMYKDMNETAQRFSRIEKNYNPRTRYSNHYTYYTDVYRKLFTDQEKIYESLFTLSHKMIPESE
jgi:xylulokinase